jgi:polysaccharide biosynthesis/export protein
MKRFCEFGIILFLLLAGLTVFGQTEPAADKNPPQLKMAEEKRYKLVPGDVLEVIYRYTPEFNQTVAIQPDGFVVLEIVGELKVGTLTIEQTRQEIIRKASVRLKDPEVTLLLKEFQKPFFVVSGEVAQPGKFEMREPMTALQAVLTAGGFKESAKSSQIVVFRKINLEFAEVKTLNLKGIKNTSDLENDLTLDTGDIIFVPRNNFSKFEKFIKLTSIGSILNPIFR